MLLGQIPLRSGDSSDRLRRGFRQFLPDSPERLAELADYVEGRSGVPLPTYFVGDYGVGSVKFLLAASKDSANLGFKMDGLRICENLFWLKGSGKFTLHGLCSSFLGCLVAGKIRMGKSESFCSIS